MENKEKLFTYEELLEMLDNSNNHLLIANGFNNSLGIKTSYYDIFQTMIKLNKDYEIIEDIFIESNYNLEHIIEKLEESISKTEYSIFLKKYISNKVKLDFIKATYSIVKDKFNKIYQKNNEDIYILLSKFTNYFTINFDPLLYLLLLRYKKQNSLFAIEFQKQEQLFIEQLDLEEKEIFNIIKHSFTNGIVNIKTPDIDLNYELKHSGNTEFQNHIKKIVKNIYPHVTDKAIKKLSKKFLEKEIKKNQILNIDDGFNGELFELSEKEKKQNLFYIHGAFHIYEIGNYIKKIVKTEESAFNEILEEIIEDESEELIVVFRSNNKLELIEQNDYLKNSFEKLGQIEGDLVIFGSSLDNNDKHIFNSINMNEKIRNIYISTNKYEFNEKLRKATLLFEKKNIFGFDYETVSFSKSKKKIINF